MVIEENRTFAFDVRICARTHKIKSIIIYKFVKETSLRKQEYGKEKKW